MRLLREAELELVSGGDGQEIVVTGHQNTGFDAWGSVAYDPNFWSNLQAVINPQGTGVAPAAPVDYYPAGWDHQRDYNIDKVAAHMVDEIDAHPDNIIKEYSGFVYEMSDHSLHESNILPGNNHKTGSYVYADYGIPGTGTIVADIHNHPSWYEKPHGTYQANPNAINADYGDIYGLQHYHDAVTDGQYRSYISFNGYVPKYDWIQNNTRFTAANLAIDTGAVRAGYYPERDQ